MKHLDLFSGIGGFALATEMVWDNVEHIFCDNEPFSQAILKKHWPHAKIYGDIRTLTKDSEYERSLQRTPQDQSNIRDKRHFGARDADGVYLLTGGFPCQPFSQAGRRKGTADDRHLWPEMARVIREFKPRWVIGENVEGFLTWNNGLVFEQVCTDLEAGGYEVQAFVIPAVAVNAPHRRNRVWIVAHAKDFNANGNTGEFPQKNEQQAQERQEKRSTKFSGANSTNASDTTSGRCRQRVSKRQEEININQRGGWPDWNQNWLEVATRLCTLDDGLPGGLARPKGWRNAALKGAGNAIVPQVAAEIMKAIKEIDTPKINEH